ncbi:MAG TPA: serine protease [Gaiella sp.]|uniref:serine protease n=1 Tax=Gaiella sp. TaxID=2663207 RepID=UPI002D809C2B|nr:serine protease [Gaiella sp.]HET9287133.1 serine protease [Gaiella sp.]
MIIGREEMFDVVAFHAGLHAALRGVVRVQTYSERSGSVGNFNFTTGWLITDDLVVIPDFVIEGEPGRTYSCQQGTETIEAEVVLGGTHRDGSSPAVLRLAGTLSGKPLQLASGATEEHQQVFLLHHPAGNPRLHLSIGRLMDAKPPWLRYDADTIGGSSGAPVLNTDWAVVGMHTQSGMPQDTAMFNQGLSLPAMLPHLRDSPAWDEIARHHKLADVAAIRVALEEAAPAPAAAIGDAELLGAAVRWSFDPHSFPDDVVERLRPLVAEPSAPDWSLQADARSSLLRSAGSLAALREARGKESISHPGQLVIDRILAGPPYSLDDVPEGALPYWLQAARWFGDVAPSLPSPAEVNRVLERRRVRSRLQEIGGAGFRGRAEELRELRDWYGDAAAGPMVVTGIGGVGKSALVARFALELPERTLQLWLDFDRADLAPDDATSVLRLMFDQLATQLDGFRAPPLEDPTSWQTAVSTLGPELAPHLKGASPPLLVLDGFEVAQYVKQHREIWQLLDELLPWFPGVRVLVSGRAPVVNLELGGRPASDIHLEGLAKTDAISWLREGGIEDDRVLERIAEITRGVPLALRLAVRWAETGGEVTELPEKLPAQLVDGFLYQRILDRVIDPALKPVAQDALVLRRLTPTLISEVLADRLPEGLGADEVFARLRQEMALVGDGSEVEEFGVALPGIDVLRLRPEVRSATLRLLETDNRERVRTIDERAAAWYAGQDTENLTSAAELVYHRLRLGDVSGAEQAWRDGCAPLLLYADEELPEGAEAARAWLRERTVAPPAAIDAVATWERDAQERVRALLARGVLTSVDSVLAEREERSPASPLTLYDAWSRWSAGDLLGARRLLDATPAPSGPLGRDWAVLAAWLAAEAGDRREADRRLRSVLEVGCWADRPEPELDTLTVEAARVRLTIDLEAELAVADIQRRYALELSPSEVLPPDDVVLPYLSDVLGGMAVLESTAAVLRSPQDAIEFAAFAAVLDRARASHAGEPVLPVADPAGSALSDKDPWKSGDLALTDRLNELRVDWGTDDVEGLRATALDLTVLGWRRWRLVTSSPFLARACELALGLNLVGEPQRLSIVGTLAVFATRERRSFMLMDPTGRPLIDILDKVAAGRAPASALRPTTRQVTLTSKVLRLHGASAESEAIEELLQQSASAVLQPKMIVRTFGPGGWTLQNLALHLVSPDPLEMLVRRVVGIPDTLPLRVQSPPDTAMTSPLPGQP